MMKNLSILFASIKNNNRHISFLTPPPLPPASTLGGIFFFSLLLVWISCSLFFSAAPLEAGVKGKCKDCHTMHNSYEGKEMTYGNQTGPFLVLTRGGCIGCHGQDPGGAENIITLGKTRIPQILHLPDKGDLAGGNYTFVADGYSPDYTKGHNVKGISLQEHPPMDQPPGFLTGVLIPGGTGPTYWSGQNQLDCAGTWGCHGNRMTEEPYRAVYGAHHTDDRTIDGSSVGRSYRFLFGITGTEHKDWEYLATPDNHNVYRGDPDAASMNTISYLCGECHARFHPNANLGGSGEVGHAYNPVWQKHPTDIAFSTVQGGYAGSEYQEYVLYSLVAPVASFEPTSTEKAVVDANNIVMCLSCHRAHATRYPDILRWEYSSNVSTIRNAGNGCIVCHTKKLQ
jgi:hypothetical protein